MDVAAETGNCCGCSGGDVAADILNRSGGSISAAIFIFHSNGKVTRAEACESRFALEVNTINRVGAFGTDRSCYCNATVD